MKKLFLLATALSLTSCASVQFYNDAGLTQKSGLKIYPPKPYLLVERSPGTDVNIKTTIVYLPDTQNPTYVKVVPGLGSSDLQLELENGILKSYGLTTDSKIPETISAVTELITAAEGFGKKLDKTGTSASTFELYEIKTGADGKPELAKAKVTE